MKKTPLLAALIGLLFLLTACGSRGGSGTGFGAGTGGSRALNSESKLALGTIKLEGTPQAVDPKMAARLIPLWQLLAQLDSSSSSAPQEVNAVMDQIKTTMTPGQLDAINSMTLTQADIFTVFQEQAQGSGSAGSQGSGSTGFAGGNRRAGGGFVFFGGGGPGGAPGGGFGGGGFGGGGFGGNNRTSSSTSTQNDAAQAAQAAQARQNAISTLLIDQLIKLLQTKLST